MKKLTIGSLFAGIGGFDLGPERSEMICVWQVENDHRCNSILARHWPDVERHEDVRTFTPTTKPVLICGGFPCQDLSVAGKRAGLAGERSGLFFEFMRIVGKVSPRWVLVENVPGLLSSNGGRDMGTVLGTLAELGYGTAYRVLDAQWFGVPQRRRRVFIVGCLGDWRRAAEVLFESESLPWDTPPSREAGAGVAHCLARGACSSHGRYDPNGEDFVTAIIKEADARTSCDPSEYGDGIDTERQTMYPLGAQHEHAIAFQPRIGRNDRGQPEEVCPTLQGADAGATSDMRPCVAFTERTRQGERQIESQEGLAYSLDNPGRGGRSQTRCLAHNMQVRRLTPRECERLQGFPDDWTRYAADGTELKDGPRYRMLGNAVCVPVAEWIGQRILQHERIRETD